MTRAIAALADAIKPPPAPPRVPGLSLLSKTVETLLPSAVMFVLGYIFIQGIELDLKREEFTASSADKLKSYIEQLISPDPAAKVENLRATALALGGFGGPAVLPLLGVVKLGNEQTIAAAMLGLEQAGRIAPEPTCKILAEVIDDPTKAFQWQVRMAMAEVAGRVGCGRALTPLKQLRVDFSCRILPKMDDVQCDEFKHTLDNAIKRIEAAQRGRSRWRWLIEAVGVG